MERKKQHCLANEMKAVMDYDKDLHKTYQAARRLPDQAMATWMDTVAEFLRAAPGAALVDGRRLTILDLGSGAGRFSVPLAERFGADVIGVEPSLKMRRLAEDSASHPHVSYMAGRAEKVPLDAATVDAVFMSMILHHISSLSGACSEVARVLRPGGYVFIRNDFREHVGSVHYYDYFPSAKAINDRRFPGIQEVTDAFGAFGIRRVAQRMVRQEIDPSFRAYYERIRLKGLSTFELIGEEELRAGIEAMRKAAEAEINPQPIVETIVFLVFRKKQACA